MNLLKDFFAFLCLDQIHLIGCDKLLFVGQIRIVSCQFLIDGLDVFQRISALGAGGIYHMYQDLSALNVRQEFMAKAHTFCSTLDQTGNIRHHESAACGQIHHAQNRRKSGEMVIGDLRFCIADHGKQGGLSYVGESHQSYIRDHL